MNKISFSLTLTLVSLAIPASYASARDLRAISPSQAERTLKSVQDSASALQDDVDQLQNMIADPLQFGSDSQISYLERMRQKINKMGKQIRTLDSNLEALPPWQQQAITKVLPVLQNAAANTEKAIKYFNADKTYLWSSDYRHYTDVVGQDSREMSKTLGSYLQLARLHQREQHLSGSGALSGTH